MQFKLTQKQLSTNVFTWLITGCAGFIGSNILEALLKLNQKVVGIDNFSTGHQRNIDEVLQNVTEEQGGNFTFVRGDICSLQDCEVAMQNVDFILHQAALASVPRSIKEPLQTHNANVNGFLNILELARKYRVKRVVYASSSSVYGDSPILPKREDQIGKPLSPYAANKYIDEIYANVYARCYGMELIGLRYFNVFGKRQDPNGAYAAVIPLWIKALLNHEPIYINGDGETTRDFCYIDNIVQANMLAALTDDQSAINQIYNVACGTRITLNELFANIVEVLNIAKSVKPQYRDFRPGDIRHSLADITKIKEKLSYNVTHHVLDGLKEAMPWYTQFMQN
ncbi:MAG: SDR family oxidoreductase [Gammaproteobacteria bacterium]